MGKGPTERARAALKWPVTNFQQDLILLALIVAAGCTDRFDAPNGGNVRMRDLATLYFLSFCVRNAYNAYLEWAYRAWPAWRTQKDARVREERDDMGRTEDEVALIEWHDRITALATYALLVGAYWALPGLYPAVAAPKMGGWPLRLVAHHYCLSFGMYWAHRYLHVNKFLWKHIHSLHHYAKTPLARATYMDHWADNTANAVISEVCAQILVPLPFWLLLVSRLLRICESLEKHSGLSGWPNLVHTLQRALPFAQMPHHHDWHHEGHKGSNYTFASLGGVWDVLFQSRHHGRASGHAARAATRSDIGQITAGKRKTRNVWDHPLVTPVPLIAYFAATAAAYARRAAH